MSLFMRSLSASKSIEAMQREQYQDFARASLVPIGPRKPRPQNLPHVMSEHRRADQTLYRCLCGCWSKIVNGHGMYQWRRARQSFDAHVPKDAREIA